MIKGSTHTESQDAAGVGLNKQGYRMIYVADGVSLSANQTYLSHLLGVKIFQSSGSNTNSLIDALRRAQSQAYSDYQSGLIGRSASSLTAGVINDDNLLSFVNRGDSPAYLLRNGELTRISELHNQRTIYIEQLMEQGLTRSAAIQQLSRELDQLIIRYGSKSEALKQNPRYANQPWVLISDTPNLPELYQADDIQLYPGDQLFFMTDGVLDGYQTKNDFYQAILNSSNQDNPAESLMNDTYNNQVGKTYQDDISVSYLRIP